jgi:1,4-dihydroxy-2-naphthoyl-CoA synthase
MAAVERERRGNVEILTINRPEARNAINGEVSRLMGAALDELADDPGCSVVVLTGAGDKAFSAGMDLKAFASGEGGAIMSAPGGFAGIAERDFPKPLIAAVNGSCLAGGCEIMLSCDLVVAVEHATFGIPEAKRGLIAGAGGLAHISQAKDFGFTAHASIFRNAKTLTAMHRTALVLVPVVLGCQVLGVEYRYVIPRWAHDRERRRDEEEVRRHVDVGMCFGAASWLVRLCGLKCGRAFWAPMDVIMFGALSDLMHREYYRAHNL